MKRIKVMIVTSCLMALSSCGVVADFCRNVYDNIPLDNNGATYHTYSQQETMDMILNTREAQAWNSSAASKGIYVASSGLKAIGELAGKDFSVATNIMDATVDDLISDDNTKKSDKHSIVGAAFYGASHIAGYFEDKQHAANNDDFLEMHQDELDETSSKYDKYFFCRWQISDVTGEYVNIQKLYGMDSVMSCIRETQQNEYNQTLKEALAECNPYVSLKELDAMLIKAENQTIEEYIDQKNKRSMIIRDALKCYEPIMQNREKGTVESNESDIDDILNEEEQIAESLQEDMEGIDPQQEESNIVSHSMNELEQLEQTKLDFYTFNSYQLSAENKRRLDDVAAILLNNRDVEIQLLGHSCNIGNKKSNYTMGIQRAKVAKRYLVSKGVNAKRIYVHSYGSRKPLVPNTTPANRAKNRRVEMAIIK
ncbi:MAG: OmpA family protein [Paludibacteraceae bacterium]|nr:OmpA family protein [Paludibacteraceae bacterium]